MKKKKIHLSPPSFFVSFLIFLTGILFSTYTFSQTPTSPADCKTGCTSNDVQIQAAYLSNATGTKLPANFVCPVSGSASVFLTLELTTKTPRVGVVIYSKVKNFTPPSTIGTQIAIISECFGITLNQPTNKVTFTAPFNWQCGSPIVLTDVFIGWGTGNTDFCTGTFFQCPATSSKCYSLPPGQYIPIQTPIANPASDTKCSTSPGGSTAVFDLTTLEATIKGGQINVTVSWFSDFGLTTSISSPSSYTSASGNVYAKVASNTDPTVYSISIVTLTVNTTPAAPGLGKVDNCNGTTTVTAAGLVSGSSLTWSDGGSGNPRTVSSTTALTVTQTVNGCTSASSNSVTPAPKTTPASPSICITEPKLCGPSLGSIAINNPTAGFTYTLESTIIVAQAGNPVVFNNLAAGSNPSITASNGGCTSAAANCSTASDCGSSSVSAPTVTAGNEVITKKVNVINEKVTTVKAYPNPFSDKVKFVVTTTEGGRGSLDVYNMMGQKIKSVYRGFITPGTQTFELSLPASQLTNLMYVLRIGDKKMSGKLLQLNQ